MNDPIKGKWIDLIDKSPDPNISEIIILRKGVYYAIFEYSIYDKEWYLNGTNSVMRYSLKKYLLGFIDPNSVMNFSYRYVL